jgi:creatinine amidohydrolase
MKGSLLAIAAALLSFGSNVSAASPRPAPVMMERMTTAEIRDAIRSGKTTVLIFNASTEATGPALALGKHIVRAQYSASTSPAS